MFSNTIIFVLKTLLGQSPKGDEAAWDVVCFPSASRLTLQTDLGKLRPKEFLEQISKALSFFVEKKGKVPSYFFEQLFNHLPKVVQPCFF